MFFDMDASEEKEETSVPQVNNNWSFTWNSLVSAVKKTSEQVKEVVVTGIAKLNRLERIS